VGHPFFGDIIFQSRFFDSNVDRRIVFFVIERIDTCGHSVEGQVTQDCRKELNFRKFSDTCQLR